jgi:NAD(P)-dependent dehydrogenase (short-subunit alcohol dehydrogenase family)
MARRVAVVTGGCQGIGLAAARALQARDYDVIAADVAVAAEEGSPGVDGATGARGWPGIGGSSDAGGSPEAVAGLVPIHVDVTSRASVERLAARVAAEYGRLDCLVTCAGVTDQHPSVSVSEESWSKVLITHVDGTFRCCQVFHPLLASSGDAAIVTVSSVVARLGLPGRLSYATAKSAIEGLTRTLAVEWAPDHIRINAVAPGWTRTPPVAIAIDSGLVDEARLTARIPMGRLAVAEEVARSIAFLATSDSSYITGQVLIVDGGTSIAIST